MYVHDFYLLTLGETVQEPGLEEITSLTYRSPEVCFGRPWSQGTDIWSWGIMVRHKRRPNARQEMLVKYPGTDTTLQLCHLLEAQVKFTEPGIYDSMCEGTLAQKSETIRKALARDFHLCSEPFYTKNEASRLLLPYKESEDGEAQQDVWSERLHKKGVPLEDLEFLFQILNPNPLQRWTAREIISCGYLDSY